MSFQPALEPREDEAEQEVAPGGLREGGAVAGEGLQLVTGRVYGVGHAAERPERRVLEHGRAHAGDKWRRRDQRPDERVDRAEDSPVEQVESQAGRGPGRAACDELAEQLHVVVPRAETRLSSGV